MHDTTKMYISGLQFHPIKNVDSSFDNAIEEALTGAVIHKVSINEEKRNDFGTCKSLYIFYYKHNQGYCLRIITKGNCLDVSIAEMGRASK